MVGNKISFKFLDWQFYFILYRELSWIRNDYNLVICILFTNYRKCLCIYFANFHLNKQTSLGWQLNIERFAC